MSLPQKLPLDQMQTKWAAEIDPVLKNPSTNPVHLTGVHLVAGANIIDHRLGKKLTGWYTTRVRASATLFDQQDTNPHPDRTLILVASAPVTIDLAVF